MKSLQELSLGIVVAVLSIVILFGALLLSFSEGKIPLSLLVSPTTTFSAAKAFPTLTTQPPTSTKETSTSTPTQTNQPTSTTPPSSTPTPINEENTCIPPEGWTPMQVNANILLELVAQVYNLTMEELMKANCLQSTNSEGLEIIFVYLPTPTPSALQCGPPPGWRTYRVQPGDNLFRIGLAYGVTVPQLQFANCLGNSTLIISGQLLYVPNVVPRKVAPTPTKTRKPKKHHKTNTPSPTIPPTNTAVPPSQTPTFIPTNTPTSIPSNTPTNTLEPTPTPIVITSPTP